MTFLGWLLLLVVLSTAIQTCEEDERNRLIRFFSDQRNQQQPGRPCAVYNNVTRRLSPTSFLGCGTGEWLHNGMASLVDEEGKNTILAVSAQYHDWSLGLWKDGAVQIVLNFNFVFGKPSFGARAWPGWEDAPTPLPFCQCNPTRIDQVRSAWQKVAALLPSFNASDAIIVALPAMYLVDCIPVLQQLWPPPSYPWHFLYHHDAHAALGFYTSIFQNPIILSLDSGGNLGQSFAYHGSRSHGSMTKLQTPMMYCHFGLIFAFAQRRYNVSMEMLMGCTAYGRVVKRWYQAYLAVIRDVSKENDFDWKSLTEGVHVCDAVVSGQRALEHLLLEFLSPQYLPLANADGIILTGGVAMNFLLAHAVHIHLKMPVWVAPVPYDAGLAAGILLAATRPAAAAEGVFLGPSPVGTLASRQFRLGVPKPLDIQHVAKCISLHQVGLFMIGKQEIDNICHGHRCMLALPSNQGYRSLRRLRRSCLRTVNMNHCSYLLSFIPEEYVTDVFEVQHPESCPYCAPLSIKRHLRKTWSHIGLNGKAQVVIVSKKSNPILHSLLLEVHKLVGLPVLLGDSLKTKSTNLANSVDDVVSALDSRHPLISWVVFESEMLTQLNQNE